MSALMTPRPVRRRRTRQAPAPGGQPALFGAGAPAVVPERPAAPERRATTERSLAPERPAAAPVEPATAAAATVSPETAEAARAHRHGPTLDDLVAGAWEGLLAGAPADCVVCGSSLAPRHSAGAGIVGGRCGDCGTTVS